jgi:hypothetical protein
MNTPEVIAIIVTSIFILAFSAMMFAVAYRIWRNKP